MLCVSCFYKKKRKKNVVGDQVGVTFGTQKRATIQKRTDEGILGNFPNWNEQIRGRHGYFKLSSISIYGMMVLYELFTCVRTHIGQKNVIYFFHI